MRQTKVLLVCPGLGHIARGYETFTRECFDALVRDRRLDVSLYKGAGESADHERAIWCLRRDSLAARMLATMVRRSGYYIEQTTFAFALLSRFSRARPDVVFYSDGAVGNLLWRWRALVGGQFKLLLSNGGPLGPPGFPRVDHVHQVSEVYYQESLRAGRPAETQTLVPYGINIDPRLSPSSRDDRASIRHTLGVPVDRPVVLSVGALNHTHKRMDYVIREVASLPMPRPYLLLLGHEDSESPAIIRLGNELLGSEGFRAATVSQAKIADYYRAADVFVLASSKEGFGRVFVEALSHGLTCLAHDYPVPRAILGEYGYFGDFKVRGTLAKLIERRLEAGDAAALRLARHRSAYDRFSWERLSGQYVEMICKCASEPTYRDSPAWGPVTGSRVTAEGSLG